MDLVEIYYLNNKFATNALRHLKLYVKNIYNI